MLLTTTAWKPDAGGVATRSPRRMSSSARRRYVRSVPPCGIEGVPTQSKDTSARSSATTGSVVALRSPRSTAVAMSSSMPGSTTGLRPDSDVVDLHSVDVDTAYLVAS